jgi:hypothetical protein
MSNTFIVQLMHTTLKNVELLKHYAHTVHSTHTSQVILCSHNTDVCTTPMYSHWTECVILAKYWLWLPDDGFTVNQHMLEQPPLF